MKKNHIAGLFEGFNVFKAALVVSVALMFVMRAHAMDVTLVKDDPVKKGTTVPEEETVEPQETPMEDPFFGDGAGEMDEAFPPSDETPTDDTSY